MAGSRSKTPTRKKSPPSSSPPSFLRKFKAATSSFLRGCCCIVLPPNPTKKKHTPLSERPLTPYPSDCSRDTTAWTRRQDSNNKRSRVRFSTNTKTATRDNELRASSIPRLRRQNAFYCPTAAVRVSPIPRLRRQNAFYCPTAVLTIPPTPQQQQRQQAAVLSRPSPPPYAALSPVLAIRVPAVLHGLLLPPPPPPPVFGAGGHERRRAHRHPPS